MLAVPWPGCFGVQSSLFMRLIVTFTSSLGMIVIALITGMAFSRFSRSTTRILFSEVMTVHDYDGQPTLMVRLANERRKTILESRVQADLAVDERTTEGHRMRRLQPMTLNRDRSPLFLLTWTLMQAEDGEGHRFDFANFNRTCICPALEPS